MVRLDAAALFERLDLLGRSQNWLAGQVGVSPAYMSMLVNGGRSPSGRIRRRMQKALGVSNSDSSSTRRMNKHETPQQPQPVPGAPRPPAGRQRSHGERSPAR